MSNIDIEEYVSKLKESFNLSEGNVLAWEKMVYEEKMNGLKKAIRNAYGSYYSTLIYEGKFDSVIPDLQKLKDMSVQINENKTTEYIFITFNPKSTVDFETFYEIMQGKKQSVVSKKWMKDIIYCYEQRSEIEHEYSGYHCHMVIKRNGKKMFDIRKELKSTLKSVMEVDNPHCLNFRNIKDEANLKRIINYMTGFKADIEKHPKQYNDKNFRNHYKIEQYYKSNDHYDQYITEDTISEPIEEIE